jgi:hypothetical protein
MRRQDTVFWLRLSYWTGAIIDFIAAVAMLFPKLIKIAFGFGAIPDPSYQFAMRLGASLMLGWTVLLLWADQDPLTRKGVLLITIFPVITGIVAAEIQAVVSGFILPGRMLPTWILQIILISLFSSSYINAARWEKNQQTPEY